MSYSSLHDSYTANQQVDVDNGVPKQAPSLCLCGSLKFWDEMIQANAMLVTKNIISIPSGFSMKYPEKFPVVKDYVLDNPEKMKKIFDELHFQKIMLADGIWVLNVDDYIGDSTKREIKFSNRIGKPIFTTEPCKFCDENQIRYVIVPLNVDYNFPANFYRCKEAIPEIYRDAFKEYVEKVDGK